jgi:hypothetical protein
MGKLNTKLHYIMDWDLWTQLYKAGAKFYYLNKPLSAVRMYPETKTASRSKARYTEIKRHLKENMGILSRMRVLLGFYYSDMKMGRKSVLERAIFYFLNRLRSIKNIIGNVSKKKNPILYGFERSSNLVKSECEVFLPFYGKCVPRQLVINCRNVNTLQVYVNNSMQNVSSSSSRGDYYSYVVKIKEDLIGSILKLNLSSSSKKPWRLISVNIT